MSTDGLPRLYSPEEVADAIPKVSAWSVRQEVRKGRYPCIRVGARRVIAFTRAHFDEIVAICEQRPFDEAPRTAPARNPSTRRRAVSEPGVELRARKPRRARRGGDGDAA
jgi:hypothetical protein